MVSVVKFIDDYVAFKKQKMFLTSLSAAIQNMASQVDSKNKTYLYISPKYTWEKDVRDAFSGAQTISSAQITSGEDKMSIDTKVFNFEKWNYFLVEIEFNGEKSDILFLEDLE